MIYSVITKDPCIAADVKKICNGAGDLMLRGYKDISINIFKLLESKNFIKCDW